MGQAIKKNKVEYIDRVHGNSKGWITRSCIDENGYSQWHYKYLELKETDLTGKNIYITLNTFYKPCRRLECIKELNFLYIDLDYYKTKYGLYKEIDTYILTFEPLGIIDKFVCF